jgi:uncharacterized protein (DUF433 family)
MNLEPPFDRITIDAGKMGGHPCIRGMRITVRRVLEILATYPDRSDLFKDYPELQKEDLQQALAFAGAVVDGTMIFTSTPREAPPLGNFGPPLQ